MFLITNITDKTRYNVTLFLRGIHATFPNGYGVEYIDPGLDLVIYNTLFDRKELPSWLDDNTILNNKFIIFYTSAALNSYERNIKINAKNLRHSMFIYNPKKNKYKLILNGGDTIC